MSKKKTKYLNRNGEKSDKEGSDQMPKKITVQIPLQITPIPLTDLTERRFDLIERSQKLAKSQLNDLRKEKTEDDLERVIRSISDKE